jgi:hypothetical protein
VTSGDPMKVGLPYEEKTRELCGARLRSGKGLCRRRPVRGRTRCRLHGGKSLQGIAHPNWKTGQHCTTLPMFSKVLAGRIRKHYEAMRRHPDLLTLREEIALTSARLVDALEASLIGECPDAWNRLRVIASRQREALTRFYLSRKSLDAAGMQAAIEQFDALAAELATLSTGGVDRAVAWRTVNAQISAKRKLVVAEVRRARVGFEFVPRAMFLGMLSVIATSINRNVKDPAERQLVLNDIRRMWGTGA